MPPPRAQRLRIACVVALVAALCPTLSVAAPTPPPPSAADEADAKKHFELGLKLYKEKIYDAALTEFELSYKLNARPSALRNMAQCHRDLKHFAEAHRTYERLISAHATQLKAAEQDAVARALADLKLLTATITFTVDQADATIQIDGKNAATTPLSDPLRVDVGERKIRVAKPGFEAFETEVKLVPQQALTLDVKLSKEVKTGKLTVKEKSGLDVHVWIDDSDMGKAPWTGELSPGTHVVELRGTKHAAPKKTVEVVLKAANEVVLEAGALKGKLRIETLVKNGVLFVDGKKVGEGTWEGDLPPGTHEVVVEAEGYERYTHLVGVNHGQLVMEAVTLRPKFDPNAPTPPEAFIGTYGRFALSGAFSMTGAGEEVLPGCDGAKLSCDTGKPIGGAAQLGVGYSFGTLSAEFVGMFAVDFHRTTRNFTGKIGDPDVTRSPQSGTTVERLDGPFERSEKNEFISYWTFGGVGGRVASRDDAVRFTAGAALGLAYRAVNYQRVIGNDEWRPGGKSTYFSPALVFDAGLLLGDTPGVKFTIGVLAWVDFGSTLTTDASDPLDRPTRFSIGGRAFDAYLPAPSQTLLSGAQFYIGPTMGLRFGR